MFVDLNNPTPSSEQQCRNDKQNINKNTECKPRDTYNCCIITLSHQSAEDPATSCPGPPDVRSHKLRPKLQNRHGHVLGFCRFGVKLLLY